MKKEKQSIKLISEINDYHALEDIKRRSGGYNRYDPLDKAFPINCARCNIHVKGSNSRQKYCRECGMIVGKERDAEKRRKSNLTICDEIIELPEGKVRIIMRRVKPDASETG